MPRLPLDLDVRPNPFNPRVEIRFLLDRAETVRATVHDLRGRRVRTLAAGPLAVGPHLLVWDGRDDAGKVTESGVYIVRLESARGVTSRKVTLLR